MAQAWLLSADQRNDVLSRVTASICGLALSRGCEIPEDFAYESAVSIEKKAYTAAQVRRTTTALKILGYKQGRASSFSYHTPMCGAY